MWAELLTEILKFFNKIFEGPRRQILKVVKIYDAMNKAIVETDTERFLIFKAHNGGSVISPTTELFISVLYEDYTHPFRSIKAEFQRVPTDSAYMRMLLDIIQSKRMVYSTDTMVPSLLKDWYIKEGVKSAVVYYLGQDRKNIYIGSCASSKTVEWTTLRGQLVTLDLAVNVIRQNIR